MKAYNNGGEISGKQAWDEYGEPDSEILKGLNYILNMYGGFEGKSNTSAVYKLSKDGMCFARNGAFKGEENRRKEEIKRNNQTRYIAITGLVVAFVVAGFQVYSIITKNCL